ncbi:MAG: hypothetical protein AAF438_18440 [Pseudomonadota bacterium]
MTTIDPSLTLADAIPGLNSSSHSVSQSFHQALEQARSTQIAGPSHGMQSLLRPLLSLNERSSELTIQATPLIDHDMKPGELMMLSMRSHEFLFHCELVSNVANRASDGVQQLFRQQS